MKKLLLINNLSDVNQYLKLKTNYNKIIVLDYRAAILCNQKKIKFIYIKNLKNSVLTLRLDKFYYSSFIFSKKIDKQITDKIKDLKNFNFFSNYSIFPKGLLFIKIYFKYIKAIMNNFPNYKIHYFKYSADNEFDYFLETIKILKKKFICFKQILTKSQKDQNFYFSLAEEAGNSIKLKKEIINIFKKFQNINFYKKKILIHLVNKNNEQLIRSFLKSKKISLTNFLYTSKIKKKISLKNYQKFIDKKDIENKILINYIKFLTPFVINTVINVAKIVSKIKNIDIFINGNNTLISNTITSILNNQKIKTLSLLHGGTLGHFHQTDFWPFLNFSQLKNKKFSYFQVYSNSQKKIIISQNKSFKLNYPSKNYLEFHNIDFKKIIKNKKKNTKKLNICYVVQIGNSIFTPKLNKKNDPFQLYLQRNELFNSILSFNKYRLLVSAYNETPQSLIFSKNLNLKFKVNDLIKFEHLNVIKMLKKSDIAIFEHPSTSYIEAICLNIPIIIILNNPLYSFDKTQKKYLSKRVYFIDSLEEIIAIIQNHKKNTQNSNEFLKKYYSINRSENLKNILINLNNK